MSNTRSRVGLYERDPSKENIQNKPKENADAAAQLEKKRQ
jgi:hypothetical protein